MLIHSFSQLINRKKRTFDCLSVVNLLDTANILRCFFVVLFFSKINMKDFELAFISI